MADIQSPTLIIGLGGTGVAVLRKFKQRYIELYGTDERLVKLLAIDTADQPKMDEPPLTPLEFFHLGDPPINVTNAISQAAHDPALDWLRGTRIPSFVIGIGAGMKRFYGHIAYFFRGRTIRERLEQAVKELMYEAGRLPQSKAGFRVFVVSSLCGGTGTGMFLDVAYMADDVVTKAGLGSAQSFGLLFLPSAFQELRANNFWTSINANGYAALQELKYYMTLRQRATDGMPAATLRMPHTHDRTLQLQSEPFQYCYLLGGVDEAGHPVAKSADLYDRAAEFLFMTATSDIGNHLTAVAVDGDKCFASFGSCNLQLPQERSLQKYFVLMGREILNDIFGDPSKDWSAPNVRDTLASVSGYLGIERLRTDAAAFLADEVFIRHNMQANDSQSAVGIVERVIVDLKGAESRFNERLRAAAAQMERDVRELVKQQVSAVWNLEAGTLKRAAAVIDSVLTELAAKRQALQAKSQSPDLDAELASFKSTSRWPWPFKKGDSQLAGFQEAAVAAFDARAQATLAGEHARAFASISNELQHLKDKLTELARRKAEMLEGFQSQAKAHLLAIAQEQGNPGLLDPANVTEDDEYKDDRLPLLSRCRSREEVRATLGDHEKAEVSVPTLVRSLFAVVEEYVEQKTFKGDFTDDEFQRRLSRSKINLQLIDTSIQPRKESYLFVNGSDEVKQAIRTAILQAPRSSRTDVQLCPGVNPGTATFVRLVAEFKLDDLVEMRQMASAYEVKSRGADAVYLDLPTHKRASIIETGGEEIGPELFAFGQILLGLVDVGENYLLRGRPLLHVEERDPVRRRKTAYEVLRTPDFRSDIEQARNATAQSMGSNDAFVGWVREQLRQKYGDVNQSRYSPEYKELLTRELAAAEAYLTTLQGYAGNASV